MKVLVYGANGWIGTQFIELLMKNNIDFIKGTSRVNKLADLKKEIQETYPTNVISFIGITHGKINDKEYSTIDYLEQKGKLYENIMER